MEELSERSVLRPRSDVRYRMLRGEAMVVRQEASEVLALNEIAGAILDLLDGERPLERVVDALEGSYEVDRRRLQADVIAFAGDLVEAGVVEVLADGERSEP